MHAFPLHPGSLVKLGLALCAAALVVLMGQEMASQLPQPAAPPVPTPAVIIHAVGTPPSRPSNALPTSLADLNGGERGFAPEHLTVNQQLPGR